jgi:hypothetical protein
VVEVPESLVEALRVLELDESVAATLADHPGRRVVVRAGDLVLKAFTEAERGAWEREVAAEVVMPLVDFVSPSRFVHGDWGTANVLIPGEASMEVLGVIDFEDSHVGDPAEDFKWQILAGVDSDQ